MEGKEREGVGEVEQLGRGGCVARLSVRSVKGAQEQALQACSDVKHLCSRRRAGRATLLVGSAERQAEADAEEKWPRALAAEVVRWSASSPAAGGHSIAVNSSV